MTNNIIEQNQTSKKPSTSTEDSNQFIPLIFIDSNEQQASYFEILKSDELFQIESKKLEIGDIQIGQLIIERKTTDDFHASIDDGRLFKQLILMKRLYSKKLLLIEGNNLNQSANYTKVQAVLTKITATMQIPIQYSSSGAMTAQIIKRTAIQIFGFGSYSFSRSAGPYTDKSSSFYELHVLIGLPGVGLNRGRALLSHFKSLQKIFNATVDELKMVEGVGSFYAQDLFRLFRGDLK